MKKIFTLAIALIAFVGVASAQSKVMRVNLNDSSQEDYYTNTVESVTFINDPWEIVAIGNYTFAGIVSSFPSSSNNLYLLRNSEDPTQYRIDEWLQGNTFYFTCDSNNSAYVLPDQETGYTGSTSGYSGPVLVEEANDYTSWSSSRDPVDENSYYDSTNDTYYFAVAYYMYSNDAHTSRGLYGYTGQPDKNYGYETFTVTSRTSAPAKKSVEKPQVDVEPIAIDYK